MEEAVVDRIHRDPEAAHIQEVDVDVKVIILAFFQRFQMCLIDIFAHFFRPEP